MSTLLRALTSILLPTLLTACDRNAPAPSAEPSTEPRATAQAAPPPLLTRELLFGNPERANGQISPDGRWLGYIAPRDGVLNVYVAPSDDPQAAKPVTNDRLRGIRGYAFAFTGNHVLYGQDVGGDENFQVFLVDLATGEEKTLTPKGSRAGIAALSPKHPNEAILSVNDRDPMYFDLLRVDLKTGEQTRLFENKEFLNVIVDRDFALRYAAKQTADGGQELFVRDGDGWRSWSTIPQEDSLTTGLAGMTTDGKTTYMLDSRDRNTSALFAIDAATGERRLVHEDARADVGGAMVHPETGAVQAALVNYLRNEWKVIDPAIAGDLEKLKEIGDGEVNVGSRTLADDKWVVVLTSSTAPPRVFLYDRTAGTTKHWFDVRPALADAVTAPMHTAEIKSRDGLTLLSYFTLPPESDPDGDGKPATPVPMVLFVHGGPWGRDGWGFNAMHQWLANRGYAVLARELPRLHRLRQGVHRTRAIASGAGKMHDDLLDAVELGRRKKDRAAGQGRDHGRQLRRLRDARRHDVHARRVRVRRRHRRAVEPRDAALDDPAVLGPADARCFKRASATTAPRRAASSLTERSPLTYVRPRSRGRC